MADDGFLGGFSDKIELAVAVEATQVPVGAWANPSPSMRRAAVLALWRYLRVSSGRRDSFGGGLGSYGRVGDGRLFDFALHLLPLVFSLHRLRRPLLRTELLRRRLSPETF